MSTETEMSETTDSKKYQLYVQNLPSPVTESTIKSIFSDYGTVTDYEQGSEDFCFVVSIIIIHFIIL